MDNTNIDQQINIVTSKILNENKLLNLEHVTFVLKNEWLPQEAYLKLSTMYNGHAMSI